jgi:hypothetical protein
MTCQPHRVPTDAAESSVTGVLPVVAGLPADASPDEHADVVGLRYVSDDDPGIRRQRRGRGFSYVRPDGRRVPDGPERERCKALAVPPAWTEVWICPHPEGHIQATGIDDAGRKQYRYHPRWRSVRDATKSTVWRPSRPRCPRSGAPSTTTCVPASSPANAFSRWSSPCSTRP